MKYTGERAVPWNKNTGENVMCPHIMRYAWATRWAWQKTIIDLGCGTGYGSYLLSMVAEKVIGVDDDPETIDYARAHFRASNLSFYVHDLTKKNVPYGDLYVAFELWEHLDVPEILLPAPLLWSMPIDDDSQFHKRAYSIEEIDSLLGYGEWFQAREGTIAPRRQAWFRPLNVLGLRRCVS